MAIKNNFFEGCCWIKLNNLGLILGLALTIYNSFAKRLKLKFRKFLALTSTFVEVTGKKLIGLSWIGLSSKELIVASWATEKRDVSFVKSLQFNKKLSDKMFIKIKNKWVFKNFDHLIVPFVLGILENLLKHTTSFHIYHYRLILELVLPVKFYERF